MFIRYLRKYTWWGHNVLPPPPLVGIELRREIKASRNQLTKRWREQVGRHALVCPSFSRYKREVLKDRPLPASWRMSVAVTNWRLKGKYSTDDSKSQQSVACPSLTNLLNFYSFNVFIQQPWSQKSVPHTLLHLSLVTRKRKKTNDFTFSRGGRSKWCMSMLNTSFKC